MLFFLFAVIEIRTEIYKHVGLVTKQFLQVNWEFLLAREKIYFFAVGLVLISTTVFVFSISEVCIIY